MRTSQVRLYRFFAILACISLLNFSAPLPYVLSQSVPNQASDIYLPMVTRNGSNQVDPPTPTPTATPILTLNQEVSIYLPVIARDSDLGNPPTGTDESGWVSGVVYDSVACNQYLTQCTPIAGVRITVATVDTVKLAQARAARKAEIAASGYSKVLAPSGDMGVTTPVPGEVTTDSNGAFTFPVSESGAYWLRADKNGYTYAQRQINITKGRGTATNAIYLTPLDSKVTSCTSTGCTHTNSDNSIQLVIPPGAIPAGTPVDVTATNFKQVEFLPSGDLPEGTWETYAFNLGGDSEFAFAPGKTATLRLKNEKQFAAGTKVPLGYWNQATQAWEHSGTGVVDASGTWIEMQVAHFSNYDCNDPISEPNLTAVAANATTEQRSICNATNPNDPINGEKGCFIPYRSGQLHEWVDLPLVQSLGASVAPQLRYSTNRASPSGVIDVDLKLNNVTQAEVVNYINWELYIEGEKTDSFTFNANVQANGEAGRYRYFWDGYNARGERLPAGIYKYQVKLSIPYRGQYCYALNGIFGNPPDCVRGATGRFVDAVKDVWVGGTVLLDNQVNSPLGAGWTLGLQRLYPQPNNTILLTGGDGSTLIFNPDVEMTIGGFNAARGGTDGFQSGSNYISARAALTESFSNVSYVEFGEVTPETLKNADLVILSPARENTQSISPLSAAEKNSLFDFVKTGHCAVLFAEHINFAPQVSRSLVSPFGLDVTGEAGWAWVTVGVPTVSPVTDGPFGLVSSFQQNRPGGFNQLGSYAKSVATNQLGVALAVIDPGVIAPGSGGVVLFSDSNMFDERGTVFAFNRTLFLNTISFCTASKRNTATQYIGSDNDFSTITKDNGGGFTRRMKDGTQHRFNASGLQTATIDRVGKTTAYTYNADGSIATMGIIAPGEQTSRWVWTFTYAGGKLSSISDPAGRTTTITVDVQNNLVAATLPDNTTRRFAYDGNHRLVQETDQNNAVTDYAYDKYGRITTLTEPPRSVYNPATGAVETKRAVRTFTPSDTGYALINDSPVGDPANPAPAVPLSSTLIDRVVYGRGQRSGHTNRWGSWLDQTDGIGRTSVYTRDAENNITRINYPNGECVTYTYDSNANPLTETHLAAAACASASPGKGQTWIYTYEPRFNQRKTETDPLGQVTTYIYDYEENQGNAGHVIRIQYPQVANESGNLVTPKVSFTYNALGLLESATDMQGIITRYTYSQGTADEASGGANAHFAPGVTPVSGLLIQMIEDAGDVTHLNLTTTYKDYDAKGNAQTVTDPRGNTTNFTYDTLGRLLTSTAPLGEVTKYEYDSRSNLLRLTLGYTADGTSGRNQVTQFTYDSNDRLLSQRTETDSQVWSDALGYDSNGQPATYTNSEGQTAIYSYDDADQLTGVTDPLGQKTQLAYTGRGQLQSAQLANNTVISFTYDSFGNLATLMPPGRTAHRFDYTARNELAAYRPPALNAGATDTTYTYDALGQLTTIKRPDNRNVIYTYDSFQRLHGITFSRGQTAYAYHPATSQLTAINAPGVNLAFGYERERLTSTAWSGPFNGSVQFTYDATGRTTGIAVNNAPPVAFQYDTSDYLTQAGDLAISRLRQSRQVQSTSLGQVNDTWTYDSFGKVSRYQANAGATTLYAVDYTYDKLNRIAGKTETIGGAATYAYAYDAVGRLIEVKKDGATAESYTYDANGNRLTALGITASYDSQDRLLTYGGNSYTYTPNGELLTKNNANGVTAYTYDEFGNLTAVTLPTGGKVEYLIDGLDRRIGKKVNGALVQGFLYEDQLRPVAEVDGSGNVVSRFVYGDRINVPEYMAKGGSTYRLVLDHLGSVRLVVNTQNGQIAQRLDYDAFGQVLQDTSPGFQPFGFAGGLYDRDTKLVRFGARDYDAEIGRWTTKDPIGFAGRDGNLYRYVGGDPVNLVDPTGEIIPLLLAGWAAIELGLSISDLISTIDTLADPCASLGEKVLSGSLFALGVVGPGGGYSTAGRFGPKVAQEITEGTYEFTAKSGKIYVGQSGNISQRLQQHIKSGKLDPSDLGNVQRTYVPGGKTAREIAEQQRIDQLGGIRSGNLENKVNPIGPNRRHLLK